MAEMVKCEVCLEKYPENKLEQHHEACVVRLIFRCAVCYGDYVSKTGLWNHLDLHEIADESKELHYQELKATHKLHQCTLCNDQRGYQENSYWEHVHDVHDGYFLRCSECGESFRSQKLKTDHDLNYSKAWEQTISLDPGGLDLGQSICNTAICTEVEKTASFGNDGVINDAASVHDHLSWREQNNDLNEDSDLPAHSVDSRLSDYSLASLNVAQGKHNNITEKESEMLPNTSAKEIETDCTDFNEEENKPQPCSDINMPQGENFVLKMEIQVEESTLQEQDYQTLDDSEKSSTITTIGVSQLKDSKMRQSFHMNGDKIRCKICGCQFEDRRKLQSHMLTIHNYIIKSNGKHCTCPICGVSVSSFNKLRQHKVCHRLKISVHTEKRFQCPHCPRKFVFNQFAKAHLRAHKNSSKLILSNIVSRGDQAKQQHEGDLAQHQSSSLQNLESEDVSHGNENKIKEKRLEDETLIAPQSSNKSSKCHEVFSNGNVSHVRHKDDDQMGACSICGVTFDNKRKLNHHKLVSHTEPKYKCSNCPLAFHLPYVLRRHETVHSNIKTKANKVLRAACKLCSNTFRDAQGLRRHLYSSHPHSELLCDKCDLKFTSHHKFNYHMKRYHAEPRFKCPDCRKPYYVQADLQRHMNVHFKAKSKNQSADDSKGRKSNKMKKKKLISKQQHDCGLTQHQSSSVQNVESEYFDHGNEIKIKEELQEDEILITPQYSTESSQCQEVFNNRTVIYVGHEIDTLMKSCSVCGVTFDTKRKLEYHEVVAHTEPKYKCVHCPMMFFFGHMLGRHEKVHNKNKTKEKHVSGEACTLCSKTFQDGLGLRRHIYSAHPHSELLCDKCDLKFDSLYKFQYHMKKFHTEPRFKCTHCGKQYFVKYAFVKHMAVHLKAKRKRMKENKKMSKQLVDGDLAQHQNSSLQNVEIEHSDHENEIESQDEYLEDGDASQGCQICGLIFENRRKLNYHKLVTHTEPKHKCSNCPKSFHLMGVLRRHEKIHRKIQKAGV